MELELLKSFTALEVLLMGAVVSVVGGMATIVRYFYLYMKNTNKERAEEIRRSAEIQTKLVSSIDANNQMIQQLPERLADKIQLAATRK